MIFASGLFLYCFLPVFLAAYYLTPNSFRSLTLALASYVFYGWWRPDFVLLMLISTVVDYIAGRGIVNGRQAGRGTRRWVVLSAVVNLGLLAYFKYANFGIDTLNATLVALGVDTVDWIEVVLPVGISFYTFQTLSYTIDVYRGDAPPVRNFRHFMCYVAMFPQLVAGPIVRYNTIAEQLHSRRHSLDKFFRGVLAFQVGLAKKILLADPLSSLADAAFATTVASSAEGTAASLGTVSLGTVSLGTVSLGTVDAWIGCLAYTLQIYFDFSGYSDMAIGLGLMVGFRLPINFDQPYRSASITEFWRRWHISLSSFLRDYLYIPLGGNRLGTARTYVNLSVTMLLGGLWHGAAWTFIIWGAYQGLWLVVERLAGKRPVYKRLPRAIRIAVTFVLVMIGWVFFRAESLPGALAYLGAMVGFSADAAVLHVRPLHVLAAAAAVAVVWLAPTTQVLVERARTPWVVGLQFLFMLALLHLHYQDHVPFLYFQF